jgi:phage terminase large subunit GpA-like protein
MGTRSARAIRHAVEAPAGFDRDQREWLATQFENLTTELAGLSPSRWAETKRYLPPQATSLPGYYRFEVTPYLREILDCMSVFSPIREVTVMKGVQLGVTVGVLENCLGYFIEEVATAPMMLLTADAELAKLRMEVSIIPMLRMSGLDRLIRPSDEKSTRKTGQTDQKLEWLGGGFAVIGGAKNADKLRSLPVQILLRDEIDTWLDVVGKDGDPLKLSADRTAAYEGSRKILDVSTPLLKGQSKISQRFERGDQRRYFVCCLHCGFAQTLRWRRTKGETGEVSGIVWETQRGRLVPDSVRYLCENCGHEHFNDDKTRLLSPDHGAEWRPTSEPMSPEHRSYHINALYSPVGMQTWGACVHKWLEAWDVDRNRARDLGELQVFYNNVLGEPFELRGEKVRFETVSEHRRDYAAGEIPNRWASEWCGSPVLLLTCSVDVHKDGLAVAVFGWCRGRRALLIDYWRFEGETERLDDTATWGRLAKLLEQDYVADDGKGYRITLTLIDSGYRTDDVYQFTSAYESGVYPVKGRDAPVKAATFREFSEFTTPMGRTAYAITVDVYKDRWAAALRRSWDGQGLQPQGHFNAPRTATDKQLRELTVETKRERIEKITGKRIGFEWHRPSGAPNELWDLLIYANAALDLIAWNVCVGQLGMESVVWSEFYDMIEQQRTYFVE